MSTKNLPFYPKCSLCGANSHKPKDCPDPHRNKICRNCGKKGHINKDCTTIVIDYPRYQPQATAPKQKNNREQAEEEDDKPKIERPKPKKEKPEKPEKLVDEEKQEAPKEINVNQQSKKKARWLKNPELDFRQIQLKSSNTSSFEVGGQTRDFVRIIKDSHVTCVSLTALCTYGYIYHKTQKFQDQAHPTLKKNFNLLQEQINSLQQKGIHTKLIVSVQRNDFIAASNPSWIQIASNDAKQFPKFLCVNSPYANWMKDYVSDLLRNVTGFEGIIFDWTAWQDCSCETCVHSMQSQDLDPSLHSDRKRHGQITVEKFKSALTAHVREVLYAELNSKTPCAISYQPGTLPHTFYQFTPSSIPNSHTEITAFSGQTSFEFIAALRYCRVLAKDLVGTIAKSEGNLDEPHSFKNLSTLRFECLRMLALGAKCNIRDTLAPSGKLNPVTYKTVGAVFEEIRRIEPFCSKAASVSDVAIVFNGHQSTFSSVFAAIQILQEGGHQFDLVEAAGDLKPYKVIILPDDLDISENVQKNIEAFVESGGKILASYTALSSRGDRESLMLNVDIKLKGDAPFSPDFIQPPENLPISAGLDNTEYSISLRGKEIQVSQEQVIVQALSPLKSDVLVDFNFCSGTIAYPAVVWGSTSNKNLIYFAHPIFQYYSRTFSFWARTLVLNALSMLLPDPLVKIESTPTSLLVSLMHQKKESRYVLHMLNYFTQQTTHAGEILLNAGILFDVKVSIKLPDPTKVQKIELVAEQKELAFEKREGRVEFVVPKINGYRLITLTVQ